MKLQQNKQGIYYMSRPLPGIGWTTWHTTQEGAALLERKRVKVGDEIPQKVFEELQKKNYLYTGGSGPTGDVRLAPGPERITWVTRGSSKKRWGGASSGSKTEPAKQDESTLEGCLGLLVVVLVLWAIGTWLT